MIIKSYISNKIFTFLGVMVMINIIGNKTWCRPILSDYAYLCPTNQASALQLSNLLVMSMITDQIGLTQSYYHN